MPIHQIKITYTATMYVEDQDWVKAEQKGLQELAS